MTNEKTPKKPLFCCDICEFITNNKKDFGRHQLTLKHQNTNNTNEIRTKNPKKPQKTHYDNTPYNCECGKKYKHASSLWNHRQKCQLNENQVVATPVQMDASNNLISCDIVVELLKQNNEFKTLVVDLLAKNIHTSTNNINSNNNTKNKFNLNFFLNEQCKDALNIMDFVNTMQLQLSDLERVGELGYVKGISHIVVNKLKDMDICKRPIHCSDAKRETLYVKDQGAWEKENAKNEKLSKMVKHVAHKNFKQLTEWQQMHPSYKNSDSPQSEEYLKIVGESMGGSTEEEDTTYCKNIIKNIAKEVVIESPQK